MTDVQTVNEAADAAAVLYLRVSTKEQAQRDGDPEGYSIPAQREACKRKAQALGAVVIDEFVDRGESARSSRRAELQRMLTFVVENPVDYVIVHKVDRLARNRADDVEITLALQAAGATLVSCTESIDETPSGILLHGIMSSIAEFYSRNLANEVMKGLVQKAKSGGTPMRAPLGYRNVRRFEQGREIRTVEVDPVRGPLISWAFGAYATGDWTQKALLDELTKRGLDVPATRTKPANSLSLSYVQYMLVNPYYKGIVRYRSVEYQGRHDPLVSETTWQRVQDVLAEKSETRQKLRKHPHYLKGIYCGDCGSSMIVTKARSRAGRIYPYFVCIGRHQKRTNCTKKAVLIERVEELVEQHYAEIRLPDELLDIIERNLRSDIAAYYEHARSEHDRLGKQRSRLLAERDKLLEAHYADAIPLDLLKREQDRIAKQLALLEERVEASADHQALVEANLESAMKLARDCQSAYLTAPPKIRRLFNQAFFTKLYIDDEDTIRSELAPPFNVLLARGSDVEQTDWTALEASYNDSDLEAKYLEVAGLKEHQLVGAPGIEPGTSRV